MVATLRLLSIASAELLALNTARPAALAGFIQLGVPLARSALAAHNLGSPLADEIHRCLTAAFGNLVDCLTNVGSLELVLTRNSHNLEDVESFIFIQNLHEER